VSGKQPEVSRSLGQGEGLSQNRATGPALTGGVRALEPEREAGSYSCALVDDMVGGNSHFLSSPATVQQ
jgi:hypothetical protein